MTIHTFGYTGTAYDACQCYDALARDGEILHIPSESVVGLSGTWPVAVTEAHGQLHQYRNDGDPLASAPGFDGYTQTDCVNAVQLAVAEGYPIHKPFKRFIQP